MGVTFISDDNHKNIIRKNVKIYYININGSHIKLSLSDSTLHWQNIDCINYYVKKCTFPESQVSINIGIFPNYTTIFHHVYKYFDLNFFKWPASFEDGQRLDIFCIVMSDKTATLNSAHLS